MNNETIAPQWERLPGETSKAWEAFSTYRDLGKRRGISKASAVLGKTKRQLEAWSSKFDWVSRAAAFDVYHDRRRLESALNSDCELHGRKLEAFRLQNEQMGQAQMMICGELLSIAQAEIQRIKKSKVELGLRDILALVSTAARIAVMGSELVAQALGVDQILMEMEKEAEEL
jgi:hypothetical protein